MKYKIKQLTQMSAQELADVADELATHQRCEGGKNGCEMTPPGRCVTCRRSDVLRECARRLRP